MQHRYCVVTVLHGALEPIHPGMTSREDAEMLAAYAAAETKKRGRFVAITEEVWNAYQEQIADEMTDDGEIEEV